MDENYKIERRRGVGGSDVAAILGLSPWRTAMDVWLEKKGLLDEERIDANRQFLMDLGTELEPVIAKLYERETQKKLTLPFPMQWKHKKHEILIGTPDRFVEGESRGVELKSESQFSDKFGDPGTDQVPPHYLVQCAHYMAVLDFPFWDVALLHAGTRFGIYTIARDKELEEAIIEQVCGWWERHIVKDVPPEIDGGEGWSTYLKKKFPENKAGLVKADDEAVQLVERLKVAKLGRDFYEHAETDLENRIKFLIGEHDGITGPFGKITWRKTKDFERTDWKLAYEHFLQALLLPHRDPEEKQVLKNLAEAVRKAHATPTQGVRRFLFTEDKGWLHGDNAAKDRIVSGVAGEIQERDRASAAQASERGSHDAHSAHLLSEKSETGGL